jgi:beta-galactosidase
MKPLFLLTTAISLFFVSCSVKTQKIERETNFNNNWQFIRADVASAEQFGFDDNDWRTLDLPHDYSIEDLPEKEGVKQVGPFSEVSAGGRSTGHVVGGTAWYRKHFKLKKTDTGKKIQILFDGVYMNADFWINGKHLGNHPYGYTAFSYDLTPHLNPAGQDNVLAVQVKNEGQNSRWYSGSGIYRAVTLLKLDPVHVDLWGVYISTPKVTDEKATVSVDVTLANDAEAEKKFTLQMEFKDPDGNLVTTFNDDKELAAGQSFTYTHEFEFPEYRLWSIRNPELYTVTVKLLDGKKVIDELDQPFGIRTIEFSPEKGFLLNGEITLLKGGCLHHDNGPLGSATFKSAEYRRVRIMKENGFNAIRTAHNPPSKLFLDACDKLGMLVIDESFDQWQLPKNPQDYHLYFDEWWERDMESMLLRDRNHPSVIIWSVGNEIKERADSSGVEIVKKLKSKVKEFDQNRPVAQAVCSLWEFKNRPWEDNDVAFQYLDVHGYNYNYGNYESDFAKFPDRIIIGTESFPIEAFENWQMVEKNPYVIGDFVWTGMDHLGESGIGSTSYDDETINGLPPWPWFVNYSGDISILGFKKPQMYYRDVVWRNSELEMLVHSPIPRGAAEVISRWGWPDEMKSWNLPTDQAGWVGNEGTPLQVSVYSRCQQVRLELNGEVIGIKSISEDTKLTATFEVPYQPGELVAIGLNDGKEVTRQTLKTTGKPYKIQVTAEPGVLPSGQNDLAYFNVEVLDENGLLVPNAEIPVKFEISGPCKLQAVANENPKDMHSFQQPVVNTFRGKCQLIVRLKEDKGEVVVSAKSEGLKSGEASFVAK